MVEYNIVEKLGVIGDNDKKMSKQLTLTEWGDYKAKYDLRPWNDDYSKCGKGISLSKSELRDLRDLLNKLELGE